MDTQNPKNNVHKCETCGRSGTSGIQDIRHAIWCNWNTYYEVDDPMDSEPGEITKAFTKIDCNMVDAIVLLADAIKDSLATFSSNGYFDSQAQVYNGAPEKICVSIEEGMYDMVRSLENIGNNIDLLSGSIDTMNETLQKFMDKYDPE
jgi:hypothetical protein